MSQRVISVAHACTPLDSSKPLGLRDRVTLPHHLKVGLYSTHFAEEQTEAPKRGRKRLLFTFCPQPDAFPMAPAPKWEALKCQSWEWDSSCRDHRPLVPPIAPHLPPPPRRKTTEPAVPVPSLGAVGNAWGHTESDPQTGAQLWVGCKWCLQDP